MRDGYYFSGWRNLPKTMPERDVTVQASMYPVRYKVEYFLDGTLFDTVYVPYGEPISALVPELTGRTFIGWDEVPAVMPMQDIVPQSDDGCVVAKGTIDGQPAVVIAMEGKFQGGSIGEVCGMKMAMAFALARQDNEKGIPTRAVLSLESGGVRLQEKLRCLKYFSRSAAFSVACS